MFPEAILELLIVHQNHKSFNCFIFSNNSNTKHFQIFMISVSNILKIKTCFYAIFVQVKGMPAKQVFLALEGAVSDRFV